MKRIALRAAKLASGVAALAMVALTSGYLVQDAMGVSSGGNQWLTSAPNPAASDPHLLAPKGNWSVAQAKGFNAHSLWWLGEEYEGQPLTAVIQGTGAVTLERPGGLVLRDNSVTFLYGSCVIPEHGGCAAPYQVIVERNCDIRPDLIPGYIKGDAAAAPFRGGATLQEFADGHYQIATGAVTITVFGPTVSATRKMADDLTSVNLPSAVGAGAALAGPSSDCGPPPFAAKP